MMSRGAAMLGSQCRRGRDRPGQCVDSLSVARRGGDLRIRGRSRHAACGGRRAMRGEAWRWPRRVSRRGRRGVPGDAFASTVRLSRSRLEEFATHGQSVAARASCRTQIYRAMKACRAMSANDGGFNWPTQRIR